MQKRRIAEERRRREAERERAQRLRRLQLQVAGVVGAAVVALAVVFVLNSTGGSPAGDRGARGGGQAGQFAFAVGDPGPGETAPTFRLSSTSGGSFDLGAQRGKRVLLYFQEGISCQPCWDQIVDLEKQQRKLAALGIDEVVSITTDPLDQVKQKQSDEGFSTPVLSDPDLRVSKSYAANQYGMMGTSRDGHSFIVVGPDGRIEHRADYGGEPDFTMYVPPANLLADIRKGMRASAPEPVEVMLLTQDDCALCEQSEQVLDRLAREFPLAVEIRDLASKEGRALAERGGLMFPPGLFLDGQPFSYGRVSERKLRRELRRRSEASERARRL